MRKPKVSTHKRPAGSKAPGRGLRVGFIGAGRVGSALAWHCKRLGYSITGISDKMPKQAWVVYGLLKMSYRKVRPSALAEASDVLFLSVPDRHIEPVFVAIRRWLKHGAIVVHCSGVLGVEVFKGAAAQGVETLALHPIQSLSSHAQAIRALPGSSFAIEGTRPGVAFGRRLVRQLKGSSVVIAGPDRPLYHAMCVFASNFENVLLDSAEGVGARLGLRKRRVRKMLAPLMRTVLENAVNYGALASLTGPVRRGDTGTVRQHLEALATRMPELLPLYRACSLHLVEMARRQGLGAAAVAEMRTLLRD